MKFNFELEKDRVKIKVDPDIFPKNVILRTAYKFIDRAWMEIERPENKEKVVITLLPRDVEDREQDKLESLALRFDTYLITTFVEDREAERYAEARNAMVKSAMLSQIRGN